MKRYKRSLKRNKRSKRTTRKSHGSGKIQNVYNYLSTPRNIRKDARKEMNIINQGNITLKEIGKDSKRGSVYENTDYRDSEIWNDDINNGIEPQMTPIVNKMMQEKMKHFITKYSNMLLSDKVNHKCIRIIDDTYLQNFKDKQFIDEFDVDDYFSNLEIELTKCSQ